MDKEEIFRYVDHTLLKADADETAVYRLCDEAVKYNTVSVCIPPCYVKRVREKYGEDFNICTVIGFPLGYSDAETKVFEAGKAVENGADEIDMVINITDVKNRYFERIEEEIREVKKACGGKILKVIVETCYLTQDEKIRMCRAVTDAGADYIKTSTGFGTAGAKIEDIRLFKENIGNSVKIKAAGGIRTKEKMEMFIREGCSRICTSSAVKVLTEED